MKNPLLFLKRKNNYSDAFSGDTLGGRWQTTNNAWSVSGGKAIATPTLGAELFVNGAFAADTNWTKGTGWTIAAGVAAHAGVTAGNLTQAVATVERWYRIAWELPAASVGSTYAFFGAASTGHTSQTYGSPTANIISIDRQLSLTTLGFRSNANAVCSIDNASGKLITHSDMFATIPNLKNSTTLKATLTMPQDDTPAGVVGWMDDYTNPQNYVFCYHLSGRLRLEKCVAGVYTQLISTAATYGAGREIKLVGTRSGANMLFDAFYNGVQIGTQQTVSDAAIVDRTRHGMFNTDPTNTIDSFSAT